MGNLVSPVCRKQTKVNAVGVLRASDVTFIPTRKEWVRLYEAWFNRIVSSLWQSANRSDREDAVQEAFLAVMSLSVRHHLRKNPEPRTEGAWYKYLWHHARGYLSHEHQRAQRYVEFKEYDASAATSVDDGWAGEGDGGTCDVASRRWDGRGLEQFRRAVRKAVVAICREAGLKDRNIKAFVLNVFEEMSGREVVKKLGDDFTAGNLYVIRNRVMKIIKASANRLRPIYDTLLTE